MKKRVIVFLLLTALILSSFIVNSSAKEIDSLAEIASLSKLEPIGGNNVNAYTELAEVKANSLPSSYSSRDLGYTTPVRQQSSNICWAFSSLASLESLLLKSGERAEHFSPEHMNIWGSMENDGTGWQREDLVVDGGYSYIPMGYFTSWSGPLLEKEFPIGSDKTSYTEANSIYSSDFGVTEIKYIDRSTPIETIKSYIMDYGAVTANFNADTEKYMNFSKDGFYCSDGNLPTSALYGHAVSVVGWDDNYKKENFSTSYSGDTPAKDGAWLIKNSWGSYVNTNGGYFWISYEDAWLFHSIFGPSFAIADFEKLDGSKEIYQNEIYGATTQFSYLTDESVVPADTITYINVFDFSSEFPVLDKVLFESTSYDADYTVYYIPVYGDKPTQETFLWQKLGTGTIDYTGYITVDITDFDLPEGKGAIGISVDNTRTYKENRNNAGYEYIHNSLGVCEWLAFNGGYYFKNQGEAGESFVMYSEFGDSILYDLMDFYDEYFDDPMGATFVIKAITKNPDFVPTPTETQVTPTEDVTESTTSSQSDNLTLGITLEYLGDTRLNVIAKASGGTGEYTYEFSVNGTVVQSYSETNYIALSLDTDGTYTMKISVKDSTGRILSTESVTTVENGSIVIPGSSTDPIETITNPAIETTNTSATDAAKAYIIGDTDYNNNIGIKDATLIRKHLAKITQFDQLTLTLADVDDSGTCTIKDATLIQKYIALIDAPSNVGKTVVL